MQVGYSSDLFSIMYCSVQFIIGLIMNVLLCAIAIHLTTAQSNSTTSEPPTEKIKKEGPVNNDNVAGLYII